MNEHRVRPFFNGRGINNTYDKIVGMNHAVARYDTYCHYWPANTNSKPCYQARSLAVHTRVQKEHSALTLAHTFITKP